MSEFCKKPINMKSLPLVSMVIPSYNHALYIQQCIASVIAQDYKNIELIIIDDGSSDESVECIKAMAAVCNERFVRFEWRARENRGLSTTLNEALEWAEGAYFAALASDDILFPAKTSLLIRSIDGEPDVAGVFGGCESINKNGEKIGFYEYSSVYFNFEDVIKHRHTIQACTQLLRLKSVQDAGGYQANIYIEDWYMWLKLTEAGYKLKVVPDVVAQYRYHDSNSSKDKLKMFESRIQVLDYFKHHPSHTDSVSEMYIWAARDFCYIAPWKSLAYLLQSLHSNKKILFRGYFYVALFGLITPAWLAKRIPFFLKRFPNLD